MQAPRDTCATRMCMDNGTQQRNEGHGSAKGNSVGFRMILRDGEGKGPNETPASTSHWWTGQDRNAEETRRRQSESPFPG